MDDDWRYILRLGGLGILDPDDLPGLRSQKGRVLRLMIDQKWHRSLQILDAAGGTEGLRRLRELRSIPNVLVERRRVGTNRLFEYRLQFRVSGPTQTDFFVGV